MATGDGSPERPFVVTHASDEYDLLACPLKTESKSQSSKHKSGRWYDVLECANGKTYWFDITQTFGATDKPAAPANAQLAAATTAKQTAKPADEPADELAGKLPETLGDKPVAKLPQKPARKLVAAKEQNALAASTTIPAEAFSAFDRGVEAVKHRDFDRAIAEFNEVLRLDPSSARRPLRARRWLHREAQPTPPPATTTSRSIRLRPGTLSYYERGWPFGVKATRPASTRRSPISARPSG